jgi:hypothetical protein
MENGERNNHEPMTLRAKEKGHGMRRCLPADCSAGSGSAMGPRPDDEKRAHLGSVPREDAVSSQGGALDVRAGVFEVNETKEEFDFMADVPGVKDITCR